MKHGTRRRRFGAAIALAGLATLATSGAMLAGPGLASASSHREAPLILQDPLVDNTDVYAFVSPDDQGKVTLIANFAPGSVPGQGPNFYPWATEEDARYELKVDNNGDAKPDHTFRYTFTTQDNRGDADAGKGAAPGTFLYNNGPVNSVKDKTLLYKQFYTVTHITKDGEETLVENAPVAPDYAGEASMPNYAALRDEAVVNLDGGGTAFAGRAEDPFFLDIRVFDLLYGGDLSARGDDHLAGFNVNSIALQLPADVLTAGDDPVIGVWSTTSRPGSRVMKADGTQSYDGDFVQVSRLGNPLFNEVIIPMAEKDRWNRKKPIRDAQFAKYVEQPELAALLVALYPGVFPNLAELTADRADLVAILLTGLPEGLVDGFQNFTGGLQADMLRLNVAVPPASDPHINGVIAGDLAGFPNGRRVFDNVVAIELRVIAGLLYPLIDPDYVPDDAATVLTDIANNQLPSSVSYLGTFPYLDHPVSGYDSVPLNTGAAG